MANSGQMQLSDATIGVVTALPEEYAAAKEILRCDREVIAPGRGSGRTFAIGRIPAKGGGQHVVALAPLPHMGNNMAAIAATKLLEHCEVAHIIMCGIAGAVPFSAKPEDHVRLGDIVVSDRQGVIQYDFGKETPEGFQIRSSTHAPSAKLLEAVSRLRADELLDKRPWERYIEEYVTRRPEWKRPSPRWDQLKDWEDEPATTHPTQVGRGRRQPFVFHGPIASADRVLRNPTTRDILRDKCGVKAVEMEGSGIADATWSAEVGYLVVRGTCDYCNPEKGDRYRKYASVIAAAYTRAVIEALPAKQRVTHPPSGPKAPLQHVILDPQERRTLLAIVDGTPSLESWRSGSGAGVTSFQHLVSAIARAAGSIFQAPQGDATFFLTESDTGRAELGVRWGGTAEVSSPVQPASVDQLSESPALVLRNYLNSIAAYRKEFEFQKAIEAARDLEGWVERHELSIPASERCEAYVTLAEVERIRVAMEESERKQPDDHECRCFVEKARQVQVPFSCESLPRRLLGLEAYLTARSDGVEAGLASLGDATDPETIRHKLSILLDGKRYAQAVQLVQGRPFHDRWCEFAVTALVRVGQHNLARQIIEWTVHLADASIRKRCILRYAETRYEVAFCDRSVDCPMFPGELNEEEEQGLQDVVGVLQPLLLVLRGNRRVESELESVALQLAIRAHACLCNLTAAEELANLLVFRTPVPLELAELVLGGWVSTSENLATKIRADHRGSTKAAVLAALIEGEVHGKQKDAFDSVVNLEKDATTQEEKDSLCRAAVQLGLAVGPEETVRARETVMGLLGGDHILVLACGVALCLREGQHEKARALLESNRDEKSFIWLQMYAHYCESAGDQVGALDCYEQASRLVPHPKVLETVAFMGFQQGRFRIVATALERKLRQQPEDAPTRRNLAITYARLHEYAKAATHLAVLREFGSASLDDNLDYAGCLTHSGDPEKALEVYEELCSLDEPPVAAIVSRARVLKSVNRPTDAFAFLHDIRADYWDEPDFVAAYMDAAYAAGEDRHAHHAFERLLELQQQGLAEYEYLRPATLKDLEECAADFRKRRKLGFDQLLRGRLPWLLVDVALGNEPYWAWRVRAQEMPWIAEDPQELAAFTIYATNGYAVRGSGQGRATLRPLACPRRGSKVVADLSALITLHRLGLLPTAAEYFGEIVIPEEYMSRVVPEAERLVLHQLSQRTVLQQIHEALESGLINAVEPSVTEKLPFVHEHSTDEEPGHFYRLIDVVGALYESGRISDQTQADLLAVAHRRSAVDESHPPLRASDTVRIGLSSLKTLSNFRVLRHVLELFQVRITCTDQHEIDAGLRYFVAKDEVRQWHSELFDMLRTDARFQKTPAFDDGIARPPPSVEMEGKLPEDISLFAGQLATRMRLPLIADDRFCQMLVLNRPNPPSFAAFGSDRLLLAAREADLISDEQLGDALLQLLRWRYRFIVVPARVLKSVADRFTGHPPGRDLRDVARYLHDSMRDPGLFAGPEPTDPPLPLAFRIHQDWATEIAHFLIRVWADDGKWTQEGAANLTHWILSELLPGYPRSMGPRGIRLSCFLKDTVFTQVTIHSVQIQDASRANRALRTIGEGLGLTTEDYRRLVVEVIHGIETFS